jgi:hypothetical protein
MNRLRNLLIAAILLTATPVVLTGPAFLAGIDTIVPFLAGVACLFLGLQFYCGELADV